MEVGGVFAAVRDAGTDLLPEAAAPEDGFLLDEVGIFWPSMHSGIVAATGESGHFLHALETAVLLHTKLPQGGDPLDFRKLLKNLPHGGEGPGKIEVGGIQPPHDLAAGLVEAFVNGSVLAGIFFAAPVGKAVRVSLDNLPTAIRRCTIDHDILQFRPTAIRREQHASNRLVQVYRLIVGGGDDRYFQCC